MTSPENGGGHPADGLPDTYNRLTDPEASVDLTLSIGRERLEQNLGRVLNLDAGLREIIGEQGDK